VGGRNSPMRKAVAARAQDTCWEGDGCVLYMCVCVFEAEQNAGKSPRTIGDTEEPKVCLCRSRVGSWELPVDFVLRGSESALWRSRPSRRNTATSPGPVARFRGSRGRYSLKSLV
jgi:hypothetical protein